MCRLACKAAGSPNFQSRNLAHPLCQTPFSSVFSWSWCSVTFQLSLKWEVIAASCPQNHRRRQRIKQEATASLAVAKEISAASAVLAVLSVLGGTGRSQETSSCSHETKLAKIWSACFECDRRKVRRITFQVFLTEASTVQIQFTSSLWDKLFFKDVRCLFYSDIMLKSKSVRSPSTSFQLFRQTDFIRTSILPLNWSLLPQSCYEEKWGAAKMSSVCRL